MAPYAGFIGPTYQSEAVTIATELCYNLYPEQIEVPWDKTQMALYATPGLLRLGTLPDGPGRGVFYQDGRMFAVAGQTLYEIHSDWSYTALGAVAKDGNPASMASNGVGGHQLLVISGGKGYIYDLVSGVFGQITSANFPTTPILCAFIDGYFIVLDANANTMFLSALFDGLTWSGLDVAQRSTSSDNLVSMVVDHREIWLFGTKTGEAWYDTGAANFPFAPIPGSFMSQGVVAPYSPAAFDNSIAWLQGNDNGGGMVLRANGYQPIRISNHAMETAIAAYPRISDAESFVYQDRGHTNYWLNFPSGNATWVYDGSTSMWHQRSWYNAALNRQDVHRARCHAFGFGIHVVLDRLTGAFYQLSKTVYSDDSVAIHRIRRAPHLCKEKDWIYHKAFELDVEPGLGLPVGQGSNPQVALSWSNDGGQTFSNEYWQSVGAQGAYQARAQWRRLGRARDRVYQVRMTDPIPWRLAAAYLEMGVGTS